jgi:GNAT superfamily N-acetyltransferase
MIIRKAIIDDADKIVTYDMRLAEETEQWTPDRTLVEQGVKKVLKDARYGFYLVVEHEDKVIGQVLVTSEWSDWRNVSIWWLHRIYIHSDFRNKRVFHELVETLLDLARKNNIYAIRLYVHPKNMTAKNIYEHMGFSRSSFEIFQYTL